jgi:CRISPR type I-E-associated protein CasB/Cse2
MSQLKGKSDSVEGRFVALLRSHPEELLAHVRHTVSLANSHDLLLRWDDVLNALLYWRQDNTAREDKPRRSPQRRWAQEFWSVESETQATASQPSA